MTAVTVWLVISMFDIEDVHNPKIMKLIVNSVKTEEECLKQVNTLNKNGYSYQCLKVTRVK